MSPRRSPPSHCGAGGGAVLLVLLAALGGCAEVQPWERGILALPHMALDPVPLRSAARAHVQDSREAAPSGARAQGGGCGCY